MDSLVAGTRTVFVTVRKAGDGALSWTYNNNPGTGDVLAKRTAGDIVYTLKDSPDFQFCAPPEVYKDPDNQLIDPSFTAETAQVTDVHTVASDTVLGLYLFVQGADKTVYRSPDPEIINTEGTPPPPSR